MFVSNDGDTASEVDDETLLDESVSLDLDEETETRFPNPDESGEATVTAAVEGGETTERAVSVGPGSGIDHVAVTVDADGELSILLAVR